MSDAPTPPPPAGPPPQEPTGDAPEVDLGRDNPAIRPGDEPFEYKVFDHGFVRLDAAMADDLSVVNSARVSFAVRREEMDDRDKGLIRFLMRDRHGTPFEHNSFRFHIRTPIFVAREWFRHRIGCLTGDTEIAFVNTNGARTPKLTRRLDDLYLMWELGELNGHALSLDQEDAIRRLAGEGIGHRETSRRLGISRRAVRECLRRKTTEFRDARPRIRNMRLRVLNEITGEFTTGHVADVFYSGVKPVFRVTLEDGKEIEATEDHRFQTTDGWMRLTDAAGLEGPPVTAVMTREFFVLTNGKPVMQDFEWVAEQRRRGLSVAAIAADAGCSYHTVRKWLRRHGLQLTPSEVRFPKGHRPWDGGVKGYRVNRSWTDEWKESIRRARSGSNGNLRLSAHLGFAKELTELPRRKGAKLIALPVRVASVEYVGERETFDLAVEGPWHNFVANGMVVHNSFNEESARYHKLSDEFYVPSPDAVRSQVGKPGAYSFEPVDTDIALETITTFERVYKEVFTEYERLIELGVAKELARALLPFGIYTQFYWTINARALMNFLSLRNAEPAQYEIRTYAQAVERLFAEKMPLTHECFVDFGRRAP